MGNTNLNYEYCSTKAVLTPFFTTSLDIGDHPVAQTHNTETRLTVLKPTASQILVQAMEEVQ